MDNIKVENENKNIIKIFKSVIIALGITLISIFMFAIILTYTNISEKVIPGVLVIITFISILIGTLVGMKKINKNGMLNGGIIGGVYVVLVYFISSILNTGFVFNSYTLFMILSGFLSGIIGGVVSVNK